MTHLISKEQFQVQKEYIDQCIELVDQDPMWAFAYMQAPITITLSKLKDLEKRKLIIHLVKEALNEFSEEIFEDDLDLVDFLKQKRAEAET